MFCAVMCMEVTLLEIHLKYFFSFKTEAKGDLGRLFSLRGTIECPASGEHDQVTKRAGLIESITTCACVFFSEAEGGSWRG